MNRKQVKSMFGNSIEVLESLLKEYEGRLGLEDQIEQGNNGDDVEAMFERFYNRLKFMLETVCEHLHQQQSTKMPSLKASHKTFQNTYDQSLFPQPITKGPSTDQELYQLVVQMKVKSCEDKQKIISLEKAFAQAKRLNKQLEAELKNLQKKYKHNEDKLLLMAKKVEALNCEKENQTLKLKEKQDLISSLQLQIKQIQTTLQEKDLQITNLSETQSLKKFLKQQNNILSHRCADLKTNLAEIIESKEELAFKLSKFQQTNSQLLKENKKLRVIIAKKLSFLKQNQSKNKENLFLQQNKGESQQYIKQLGESLIASKNLISQTVEKQLSTFVNNLIKDQKNQYSVPKSRND